MTLNEGADDSEPLQTGEKYFFLMGRTQDLFGSNASAILARQRIEWDGRNGSGCATEAGGVAKSDAPSRPQTF